jgi:hypothetical protein
MLHPHASGQFTTYLFFGLVFFFNRHRRIIGILTRHGEELPSLSIYYSVGRPFLHYLRDRSRAFLFLSLPLYFPFKTPFFTSTMLRTLDISSHTWSSLQFRSVCPFFLSRLPTLFLCIPFSRISAIPLRITHCVATHLFHLSFRLRLCLTGYFTTTPIESTTMIS